DSRAGPCLPNRDPRCIAAPPLCRPPPTQPPPVGPRTRWSADRKSTRLNSSHSQISYAVFCLKKKNIITFSAPTSLTSLFDSAEYCFPPVACAIHTCHCLYVPSRPLVPTTSNICLLIIYLQCA